MTTTTVTVEQAECQIYPGQTQLCMRVKVLVVPLEPAPDGGDEGWVESSSPQLRNFILRCSQAGLDRLLKKIDDGLNPPVKRKCERRTMTASEAIKQYEAGESLSQLDLTGLDFSGLYLREIDLRESVLTRANFSNSDLGQGRFDGAVAESANFAGAFLRLAIFDVADLRKANFGGADMRGAALDGCLWCGATIDGARINKWDIGGPGEYLCALTRSEWIAVRDGRKRKG